MKELIDLFPESYDESRTRFRGALGQFQALWPDAQLESRTVDNDDDLTTDWVQAEALEILIAWGEKRNEAMEFIELAYKRHPDISTAEELVPLVYRLKQGIEV